MNVQPVEWRQGKLVLLDQRALPESVRFLECRTAEDVALAIETLAVRGAPAIGIAAAYGVALASSLGIEGAQEAIDRLSKTRPTAVNLFWALNRMESALQRFQGGNRDCASLEDSLLQEAVAIHQEDIRVNRAIGLHGQVLLPQSCTVLTHCNAGALATGGYGTALGIVRAAREAGKTVRVIADETRPVLQGSRLTAWELAAEGFDVTVICDSMAEPAMSFFGVDAVIVGADRVAANGDTANKIGTRSLAILAASRQVPFYVAAPTSTLDPSIATGEEIPIEERPPSEIFFFQGKRCTPEGVKAWNPAFDVTPAKLITAIITERGVLAPPFEGKIRQLFD